MKDKNLTEGWPADHDVNPSLAHFSEALQEAIPEMPDEAMSRIVNQLQQELDQREQRGASTSIVAPTTQRTRWRTGRFAIVAITASVAAALLFMAFQEWQHEVPVKITETPQATEPKISTIAEQSAPVEDQFQVRISNTHEEAVIERPLIALDSYMSLIDQDHFSVTQN